MDAAIHLGLRDDPARVAQFRSALWSAGYRTDTVAAALGADRQHLQPDRAQAVLLDRQLGRGQPLPTLIRLFVLSLPVSREDAAAALGSLSVGSAQDIGVVREAGGAVEGAVRITPYDEFLFVSSRVPDMEAVEREHVMGVTRSSINLASLTVRRPVDVALDLGCGSGFQSLFASRHSTRVIATDVNPAAIACTRFNARLNGIDNIECREGSFMEPVAGEQFDLIVSNPPFVMSPENNLLYRDAGMRGDELSHQVLRDVAGSLREGGLATVMISWGRNAGDKWDATPRSWLEGCGCDAWILHQVSQPALMHAASWHQQLAPLDVAAYDRGVARWTDYLTGLGFDAVAYGAVVLRRRRAAGNWIRSEEMPEPTPEPASAHLERMTAAQDMLAGLTDRRALLDERLTLVDGHRLDQSLVCKDGSYTVEQAVLRLTEGLQFRANVDAFNAFLVTRLDGARTLREAIAEAAAATTGPAVEPEEVEAAALRSVRRMVELGFLRIRGSK